MRTSIGLILTHRCDSTRMVESDNFDEYGHKITSEQDILAEVMCRWQPKAGRTHFDEYRRVPILADSVMLPLWADVRIDDIITSIRQMSGFTLAQSRSVDSIVRRASHKVAYLRGRSEDIDNTHLTPVTPVVAPVAESGPIYATLSDSSAIPSAAAFLAGFESDTDEITVDAYDDEMWLHFAHWSSQLSEIQQTASEFSGRVGFSADPSGIVLNGLQYWVYSSVAIRFAVGQRTWRLEA